MAVEGVASDKINWQMNKRTSEVDEAKQSGDQS